MTPGTKSAFRRDHYNSRGDGAGVPLAKGGALITGSEKQRIAEWLRKNERGGLPSRGRRSR